MLHFTQVGFLSIQKEYFNSKYRSQSYCHILANLLNQVNSLIHVFATWRLIQKVWEFRLVAYKLARIILKTLKNVFLLKKVQEFFFPPKCPCSSKEINFQAEWLQRGTSLRSTIFQFRNGLTFDLRICSLQTPIKVLESCTSVYSCLALFQ